MINRAAVILKYKAPFIQWVNDAEPYKDNSGTTLESETKDCTVYLILEDDAENWKNGYLSILNSYLRVKLKTGTPTNRFGQKTETENFLMNGSMWNVTVFL